MNDVPVGQSRAALSQWKAGRLVARREIVEALRSRALWITTALFFLGSMLLVVLPDLIGGGDDARPRTVAVTEEVGERVLGSIDALGTVLGVETRIEQISDLDAAAVRVADGELDALVRFDTDPPTVVVLDEEDQVLLSIVREGLQSASVIDALVEAGLDDAAIGAALTPTVPVVEVIDTERGGRELVALIAALVTFLLVLLLAMEIATGVAIEKSSRVSEVLLAIVPVRALLFGKVAGTGIIGISILLIGSAPVFVRIGLGAEMPPGSGATLAAAVVFSVVGLVQYLFVAAALGALVERSEDVNATVGPLTVVLFAGYIAGSPMSDNVIGLVLALFPLTSPLVMPARVALGEASLAQVLIALGLLVIGVLIAARFATGVYRRAIVRTGTRLRLRDLRT